MPTSNTSSAVVRSVHGKWTGHLRDCANGNGTFFMNTRSGCRRREVVMETNRCSRTCTATSFVLPQRFRSQGRPALHSGPAHAILSAEFNNYANSILALASWTTTGEPSLAHCNLKPVYLSLPATMAGVSLSQQRGQPST